jgi:hypothetical protein
MSFHKLLMIPWFSHSWRKLDIYQNEENLCLQRSYKIEAPAFRSNAAVAKRESYHLEQKSQVIGISILNRGCKHTSEYVRVNSNWTCDSARISYEHDHGPKDYSKILNWENSS